MDKPSCNACDHMESIRPYKGTGRRRACYCKHPEGYKSAIEANKPNAFIGYTNALGYIGLKTSPRWCPLRNDAGKGRE